MVICKIQLIQVTKKKSLYKNGIFSIITAVLRNTYQRGKDWKEIYQKNNSGWLVGSNGNIVRIFF